MSSIDEKAYDLLNSKDPIVQNFIQNPDKGNLYFKHHYTQLIKHNLHLDDTPPEDKKVDKDELAQLSKIKAHIIAVTYRSPGHAHPVYIHPVTRKDIEYNKRGIKEEEQEASHNLQDMIKNTLSPYEQNAIAVALDYGTDGMKENDILSWTNPQFNPTEFYSAREKLGLFHKSTRGRD